MLGGEDYKFEPKNDLLGKVSEKLLKQLGEFRKVQRSWSEFSQEEKNSGFERVIKDGLEQ